MICRFLQELHKMYGWTRQWGVLRFLIQGQLYLIKNWFGTNIPNVHALQNQFLTSDTYSMQMHVIPSNSGRVPISCKETQDETYLCQSNRLIGHLSKHPVDWLTRITTQDHFKQYSYSSRSFSQEPTLQKQNPMSSVSFKLKIVNLQILHWHLSQSRLQLYHHINIQLLKLTKDLLLLMTVDMQASLLQSTPCC